MTRVDLMTNVASSPSWIHTTPMTPPQLGPQIFKVESLEDYYRAKQYAFDAVHEIARAKDVIIARALACHETHSHVVSHKVGRLVAEMDSVGLKVAQQEMELSEFQSHVEKLHRAHFHQAQTDQLGGSDLHHELMRLQSTGASARDGAAAGSPSLRPMTDGRSSSSALAQLQTANEGKDTTIQMLNVEIATLREALHVLVRKAETSLKQKAEKAVEDLLAEANQNVLRSKQIADDKFLSQMIEDKKVQLLAMRSAQHEIDQLKSERALTSKALRKAEQEVVQMRLKMMERDSNMIVVSKRVKEVEGQLEEETSTSASRIEAAERLAGDLTFKYENELRRMRDMIDEHVRRNSDMMRTVEFHKKQVEKAQAEVENERQRGIEALEEMERIQKAECKVKVDEVTQLLLDANAKKDLLARQIASLEFAAKEAQQKIQALKESLEQSASDNENLREERASLLAAMSERNKGPLAFLQAKLGLMGGGNGDGDGNKTIVDVTKLISASIQDGDVMSPIDRKASLSKLASRFIRLSDFKDNSEKAEHPTISGQVAEALQQLAAGMIVLADGSPQKKSTENGQTSPSSPLGKLKNKAKGIAALSPSKLREPKNEREATSTSDPADDSTAGSSKKKPATSKGTSTGKSTSAATPATGTASNRNSSIPQRDSSPSAAASSHAKPVNETSKPSSQAQPKPSDDSDQRRKYDVPDEADYSPDDSHDDDGDDEDEYERLPPTPSLSDLEDDVEPDLYIRPKMADAESQCAVPQFQERGIQANMDGGKKSGGGMAGGGVGSNNPSRAGSRHSLQSESSGGGSPPHSSVAPSPIGASKSNFGKAPPASGQIGKMPPLGGPRKSMVNFERKMSEKRCAPSGAPLPIDDNELTADSAFERFETISRLILEKNEHYLRAVIEGSLRTLSIENATRALESDLDVSLQQVVRVLPETSMEHVGGITLRDRCQMQRAERSAAHIFLGPSAAEMPLPPVPETQKFEEVAQLSPGEVVDADTYNALATRYEKLRTRYQETVFAHELHAAMYESMRRELLARKELDALGVHESHVIGAPAAAKLFLLDPRRVSDSGSSSARQRNQIVRVSSDEVVSSWIDSVSIFLFESQKYIKKEFLPNQKPLMYEGRGVVDVNHAQELLGRLLDAMRQQRDQMIAEKKEKKKKKRDRKKRAADDGQNSEQPLSTGDRGTEDDEDADFLQTPQAEPQEPATPPMEDAGVETDESGNEGGNSLRNARGTPRPKKKESPLTAAEDEDDDDEYDDDDDLKPRSKPLIPKLHFPVNHNLERMAIDAVLQPLMGALKRKLASVGLDRLLDAEQRQGLAIELERGLDDPLTEGGSVTTTTGDILLGLLVGTRVKALQAILSLETSVFSFRDHQLQLLGQMFTSFPKQLVQRVPDDFDLERAYELVVRVSKWWDQWSKVVGTIQDDINKGKHDKINRMIDLCEMIESSETAVQTAYSSLVLPPEDCRGEGRVGMIGLEVAPKKEVVELLHARGRRHADDLLLRLDHPVPAEFSLQHRTKVHAHPTGLSTSDPLSKASAGGFSKAVRMRREAPEVDRLTSPQAMNNTAVAALSPASTVVVPTVALMGQSPASGSKWNPNAKKLGGSRWGELPASTPPKRLPPL